MRGGFVGDKRGIEGLPMRLIIIVVVAAVVLAAILAMMPKTTPGSLKVSFGKIKEGGSTYHGGVVLVKANGEEKIDEITFTAYVNVTDSNGKPISGATVIISGGGAAGVGTTQPNGTATVTVKGAKLEENQDEAYLKVTVKASGYPDYVDNHGLLLQRVTS